MFRQAVRMYRCNAQLAADLAGVERSIVYAYRNSPNGRWFRTAWDLIVLDARSLHSRHFAK